MLSLSITTDYISVFLRNTILSQLNFFIGIHYYLNYKIVWSVRFPEFGMVIDASRLFSILQDSSGSYILHLFNPSIENIYGIW